MPRDKNLVEIRNQKIKERYRKLSSVREHGVQVYTFAVIMKKLEQEFFLTCDYIAKIINQS